MPPIRPETRNKFFILLREKLRRECKEKNIQEIGACGLDLLSPRGLAIAIASVRKSEPQTIN